jgi:integrase
MKGRIEAYKAKEESRAEIFTALQAGNLLSAASADILPVIAIGLFAGLRPTEILRLEWSDIIWHKGEIDVPAEKCKTARYRYVPMPENLVEWLGPYRNQTGRIWKSSESQCHKLVRLTARLAGIAKWPADVLRHSYGSHHLALTDNAPLTAARMGHRDTTMLFKHYNNRRTREEGQAYFQIRPVATVVELPAAA